MIKFFQVFHRCGVCEYYLIIWSTNDYHMINLSQVFHRCGVCGLAIIHYIRIKSIIWSIYDYHKITSHPAVPLMRGVPSCNHEYYLIIITIKIIINGHHMINLSHHQVFHRCGVCGLGIMIIIWAFVKLFIYLSQVFHRCGVCGLAILLDSDSIASHLSSSRATHKM